MVSSTGDGISIQGDTGGCTGSGGFYAYGFHNMSKEEIKKNIEKYDENAIDIVKNSDIYEYNYKIEEENTSKHIGFIIGEKYKTPDILINKNNDGIDVYAMTSILWKAIQEQQEQIETLQEEIKLLKGESHG